MKEQTHTMKNIYRLLMVMLCLTASHAQAQLANPPIYIETIVHHGDYGEAGHNLAGYVTYKVYVQFVSTDCYLTGIYAQEAAQDCIQDAIDAIYFDFDCGVFQHELGDALGFNQLCLFNLYPTSEYDSYLTIGQTCNSNGGCDNLGYLGQCEDWLNNFEQTATPNLFDGGSFFWDENSIYGATCFQNYPDSPTNADDNARVFIGQFTTCGNMEACVNLQYVDANGVPGLEAENVCFSAVHPCLDEPLSNIPTITNPCFDGELATLDLNSGGNGAVDYTLFAATNQELNSYSNPNGVLAINDLEQGSYYIIMEDEAGCRDTTDIFNVVFPAPFTFEAVVTTDELCFGQNQGLIELQCSGGTGTTTIINQAGEEFFCNQTIDGLTCGQYTYTAEDENNCIVTSTAQIACPQELVFDPSVTNIVCFGDDDGIIFGTAFGGTGELSVSWERNNNPFSESQGNDPFDISLDNLDEGTYTYTLTDANNCNVTGELEITEPDEITYDLIVTDATCFSFCDGILDTSPTGGTGAFDITALNAQGVSTPLDALCAGNYDIVIEDAAGCAVNDSIVVSEPTEITFTADTTSVTCFGQCDGVFSLQEVSGSAEGFTYDITPATATCAAPCSGSQVSFTDLCSGQFTITITSANGCTQTASAFVNTPAPIQFDFVTENVSCSTFGDGSVNVSNVLGGTEPFTINLNDTEDLPFDSTATYTDLIPGDYFITVLDSNNCTAINYFTITEPDLLVLSIDTTLACSCGGICDGIVQFTPTGGTPNYQYLLVPDSILGPAFGLVNGICAGDFEMFLIDANGCLDSAEFTITEPDPLTIEVLLDAPTCTGMNDGSAEIIVGGGTGELSFFVDPDTYDLEPIDSVTFGLSQIAEDTLYLELADENGCRILDTLGIVPDIITDMILNMSSSPETCWNALDGTATVAVQNGNPPLSYEWDDNLLQTTATAVGLAPNADYLVRVTDAIGCNLTASVFVEANIGCFFIATAITPNGDGVNDSWILGGFEYYPDCKVNVFNRWGQTVFSSTGYTAQWDGRFNGQLLPVADYYFTIDYAPDQEIIMGTVTIKY
jgi:gliding motility-associated-like protein